MSTYLSESHHESGIYAKVVEASISPQGVVLWTIETNTPKFLDAELRTHRMLSQNSSSSRAIPYKKLEEIYIPPDIRRQQKGMQGYEHVSEDVQFSLLKSLLDMYNYTHTHLWSFRSDVHKQHLNRYIEPWTMQKKVITGTEWDNFFNLRLAADADPNIQVVARCMKEAMSKVTPKQLYVDQWHLPYIDASMDTYDIGTRRKASVARCARVSYKNHDKSDPDIEKDMSLYHFLYDSKHFSCFEHQATPLSIDNYIMSNTINLDTVDRGVTHFDRYGTAWSANFQGWAQYRQWI